MPTSIRQLKKSEHPLLLTEISDPPSKLYLRGTLPNWNTVKVLTVVGARKCTEYGRTSTESLISGLRGLPVVIVSGLALGIDAVAHHAALDAGLTTVAIPGSGLDPRVLYPASHRALAEKIVERGGCLLSEFEPAFRATTWSFPQRNRLMAGIAHAILVVEAEKKSGTLITARLAAEYNRDVLAIPGPIHSRTSEGPHYLIRTGATPITSSEELADALGLTSAPRERATLADHDATPDARIILELLESSSLPRDELLHYLTSKHEIGAARANAALASLELKGLITESMGEVRLLQ